MEKFPISRSGYEQMEIEFKHLKTVERPAIIKAIAEAREHGDLKENAEYHAAREKQGFIEARLTDLETRIGHAEIIDVSAITGDTIRFGATIKLIDEDTEEESIYQIVGEYEADINQNKIAFTAPMARALIGKKLGDSVEVKAPAGEKYYEILEVKYV